MRIHEFNPGSDRPLLHLAHANGFPPEVYQRALASLFPDYRVFSLLARPLWETPPPPESLRGWSDLGDDLLEGLRKLSARSLVGVGHSMGGVSTLYAAAREPGLFSHLILLDPTLLAPSVLWKVRAVKLLGLVNRIGLIRGTLRRKRTWESAEAAYHYFKGNALFKTWPDEIVRTYADTVTAPSSRGGVELRYTPEWEARIYRTIPSDVWKLPRLPAPVRILVIRGEHTETFTEESEKAFRKANPRAAFAVIKGAGHLFPQEKPEETGMLIADFLKSSR